MMMMVVVVVVVVVIVMGGSKGVSFELDPQSIFEGMKYVTMRECFGAHARERWRALLLLRRRARVSVNVCFFVS